MVLVRALKRCFIDVRLREEGEVFDYNGPTPKGGPLQPAEEPEPKKPVQRRGKGGGVAAPEWTTQGFKEANDERQSS